MTAMARAKGIALDEFLGGLWSSDVVRYRVAALIELAQNELMTEERERKIEASRPKRGRRGR